MRRLITFTMITIAATLTAGCEERQTSAEEAVEAAENEPAVTAPDAAELDGPVEVVELTDAPESSETAESADAPEPADGVTGEDVKRDIKIAADTAARYAALQARQLASATREKLDRLDEETEDWRAEMKEHAKQLSGEARVRWEQFIEDLDVHQAEAKVKLKELRENSGEAWEDARRELGEAMDSAAEALRNAAPHSDGEGEKDPAGEAAEE